MEKLDWAKPFGRRCKAVLAPEETRDYYGRCDLQPHRGKTEHALERGLVTLRWTSAQHLEFNDIKK